MQSAIFEPGGGLARSSTTFFSSSMGGCVPKMGARCTCNLQQRKRGEGTGRQYKRMSVGWAEGGERSCEKRGERIGKKGTRW